MTDIPQEAIDAGGEALYNGWEADNSADACRKVAKVAIAAALPFLRSQWEQDALSDAAVERLRWHANALSLDAITADDARELLRAALGEEA